jgi:hypothetical protein
MITKVVYKQGQMSPEEANHPFLKEKKMNLGEHPSLCDKGQLQNKKETAANIVMVEE